MRSRVQRRLMPAFAVTFAILVASIVTTIANPQVVFADDDDPSATMNQWSPYSSSGNDGTPVTVFTFSADATAEEGLLQIEWDFDGDDETDEVTPISGAPTAVSGVTATHVFGDENVYWPQVRSVDVQGEESDWDDYEASGGPVPMDVFWPPPTITMLQWSPFVVNVGQPVTFSATAINEVGVQEFQWDFDGDEEPDATSSAMPPGGQEASGSIQHTYLEDISTFPAVRALDNDDFVSSWDVYDIDGVPVELTVGEGSEQVPIAVMNQWGPYSSTGPDGLPTTTFTFSADGSDAIGIDRFEWDFDGDGIVDETTEANGETSVSATATHVYNAASGWIPKVRIVNVNGVESAWSPYLIEDVPVQLDIASPPMNPVMTFSPRALADIGYDGSTATAFTFTTTYSNNPVSFQWDFDGDGTVDATTATPTATHIYPIHGSYIASVTVVDVWGTNELATPLDSLGNWETVDVSPLGPSALMNAWSPYSASGPDGNKHTTFTFSATVSAPIGITTVQWDFDGDGTVDETSSVIGLLTTTTVTKTFSFDADGNYTPAVRAIDLLGQTSPWDQYNEGVTVLVLDVSTPAPAATMNLWSPYSASGDDGTTSTVFGFSASATSGLGINRFEWDFDGDGIVDETTEANGETSVSATATHQYSAAGDYTPAVRAVDTDGVASAWDQYNEGLTIIVLDVDNPPTSNNDSPVAVAGPDQTVLLGSTVTLDGTASYDPDSSVPLTYLWSQLIGPISVELDETNPATPTFLASPAGTYVFELKVQDGNLAQSVPDSVIITVVNAPSATMNAWGPYSPTAPDGDEDTEFAFSADASAEAGILRVDWDFDGDGDVDATTAISGAPTTLAGVTATHVFGTDGTYTPKVRVVDVAGNASAWDALNEGSTIITLDVFTPPVAGETYCENMTIEQLIASGDYNVIDKRSSSAMKITGTSGADLILGNNYYNVIHAGSGNDCVIAGGGNDVAFGQNGNDQIYGGTGHDWIYGQKGDDKEYGQDGDDFIHGLIDSNVLDGGKGDDRIVSGPKNNVINAGDGDDVVHAGSGSDTISGGSGDDELFGHEGNDTINGNSGEDKIHGGSGNDAIDGGSDRDLCYGGSGTNTVVNCEVTRSFSEDDHPGGGEDDDDYDRDHDNGHGNDDDYDDDSNPGKSNYSKGKTKNN